MKANLRQAAGSLLVVGLGGTELTALERAWLKLVRPAGVILFRRNIADARQTRALLDEATALCAPHSFRCVDVEGGTVDRLRDALAPMPSAQAVASRRDDRSKRGKSQRLAREHGELIAQRREGLRLQHDAGAGAGSGAARSRPRLWARALRARRGRSGGLCAQFSGWLGRSRKWSAAASIFPVSAAARWIRTWRLRRFSARCSELWSEDLAPYRELRNELPMMMVNHAAYPETPGKNRPGKRVALLDYDGAAQAHRLSRHHLLRRSGDGRDSEVHADRRGCGCGDSRGDGFAGNLPQPGD